MNHNLVDAGYAGMRVTLKSVSEPVMKALKGALALKRGCDTSIIHFSARESKSNCSVERDIQTWKGQMRTMLIIRCCLGWLSGLARLLTNIRYVIVELLTN